MERIESCKICVVKIIGYNHGSIGLLAHKNRKQAEHEFFN